jgi:charged multivesicular body protein 3
MSDELDSALDNDDIEEEIEEEVDKVLSELAGETAAQLPAAARREHATKQADAQTEPVPEKEVFPSLSLTHTHTHCVSFSDHYIL